MIFLRYKNSVLATIVSFFGAMFAVGGICIIFEGEVAGALVFIAIGIFMMYYAGTISFNKWKKTEIKEKGIEEKARLPVTGVELCKKIYNANPQKRTLNYIRSINSEAADVISAELAKNKK